MARRSRGDGSVFQDVARGCWVGVVDIGRDPKTGRRMRRKVSAATKTECKAVMHFCEDDSVHAGSRWDCLACETARRTALYGTCGDCGTARHARPAPHGSGLSHEFYCPRCEGTVGDG